MVAVVSAVFAVRVAPVHDAAGGVIAPVIPPSIGFIMFGVIADRYGTRLTGIALGWTALTFALIGFVQSFPLLLVIAFLGIWTYVAKRTTFGRHVYAVGGNAEAARRAGINVPRIKILVFMISGGMAGTAS